MKKPVAILLLAIYLFNIGGQLSLHQYFAYLADKFFTAQTEKGLYYKGDLTEVQIPVNMPAIADWTSYENISGRIDFNDVSYNYVKMKLTRTTLYLVCVPNYETTKLTQQNVIDATQGKKVPVPQKEHVPYGKILFSGKFNFQFGQFAFLNPATTIREVTTSPVLRPMFQSGDIHKPPPKSVC